MGLYNRRHEIGSAAFIPETPLGIFRIGTFDFDTICRSLSVSRVLMIERTSGAGIRAAAGVRLKIRVRAGPKA